MKATRDDLTTRFTEILETELATIDTSDLDSATRAKLKAGWQAKIHRTRNGDQQWGLFQAYRPS